MNEELKARIDEALAQTRVVLDQFENIEHRIAVLVEGQRQQLGMIMGDLKVRENQHLLHKLIVVLNNLKTEVAES